MEQIIFPNISLSFEGQKFFYFEIEAEDDDLCITDVSCIDFLEELDKKPNTINQTFDPTDDEFLHGSLVSYYCGIARAFELPDSTTIHSQNLTCNWSGTWSPSIDTVVLDCTCKIKCWKVCSWLYIYVYTLSGTHCIRPPNPPSESGLEIVGWNKKPLEFFSNTSYMCQRGMKFDDDFHLEEQLAMCLPENLWLPPVWKNCTESKHKYNC